VLLVVVLDVQEDVAGVRVVLELWSKSRDARRERHPAAGLSATRLAVTFIFAESAPVSDAATGASSGISGFAFTEWQAAVPVDSFPRSVAFWCAAETVLPLNFCSHQLI
jgi:hypothetical protein